MTVSVPCGNGPGGGPGVQVGPGRDRPPPSSPAAIRALAITIADQNYVDYAGHFLSPSISLMVRVGLWIEIYAAIGFLVGLGLASLMGQRTVPVILLIVLEMVLTPLLSRANIPHAINLQSGPVGLATTHLEPAGLPSVFGGMHGGGEAGLVTESTTVAVCVIIGWIAVSTALGAWRMMTRGARTVGRVRSMAQSQPFWTHLMATPHIDLATHYGRGAGARLHPESDAAPGR